MKIVLSNPNKLLFAVSLIVLLLVVAGCSKKEAPPGLNAVEAKGWALMETKWCYSCHMIEDKGNKIAPRLSKIGKMRDKKWIKSFLLDPKAVLPNARMQTVKMSEEELNAMVEYLASLK